MTFMLINFILGTANIFIAGMNFSMMAVQKRDGIKCDYKDYLATILPTTIGIYLLVALIGKSSTY